jgi:hypothetical protein
MGFKKCIIPKIGAKINPPKDLEIIVASTLREAVFKGLKGGREKEEA